MDDTIKTFIETYSNPLKNDNTTLEDIPHEASITFDDGITRESSMGFIICRAMIDPEATVTDVGGM